MQLHVFAQTSVTLCKWAGWRWEWGGETGEEGVGWQVIHFLSLVQAQHSDLCSLPAVMTRASSCQTSSEEVWQIQMAGCCSVTRLCQSTEWMPGRHHWSRRRSCCRYLVKSSLIRLVSLKMSCEFSCWSPVLSVMCDFLVEFQWGCSPGGGSVQSRTAVLTLEPGKKLVFK